MSASCAERFRVGQAGWLLQNFSPPGTFSFACQKRTRKAPATFEAREARIKGCSPLIIPKQMGSIQKIQVAALEDFLCCADFESFASAIPPHRLIFNFETLVPVSEDWRDVQEGCKKSCFNKLSKFNEYSWISCTDTKNHEADFESLTRRTVRASLSSICCATAAG